MPRTPKRNQAGRRRISLDFSINWFLLIFGVVVVLIALYVWGSPTLRPTLVFSAAVLAAGAALTNALNALEARSFQTDQSRVIAAIGVVDRWNSPAFQSCKMHGRTVTQYFKEHTNVDDQMTFLDGDAGLRGNLMDVLNVFEALSIGIQRDVIDDETSRQFFRSIVNEYWHATEGWIKKRRAERNNARLNKEFEWLYNQWKD